MADLEALRRQEYSTNLRMLLQQRMSKFREYAQFTDANGSKAVRLESQIDKVTVTRRTGSAELLDNSAATFTGRWVNQPLPFHFDKILDERIDLASMNISPGAPLLQAAVSSLNRQIDDDFLSAFFGTAKTGETGGTNTSFTAGNQVATTVGATTGMNTEKLDAVLELMMTNEVDLDTETPVIAIGPKQHTNLKALTQVTSGDFSKKFVLDGDGRVKHFNGFNIIVSNRLPTDGDGYRRCPVWVKSGMGAGLWFDIKPDLRRLPNYKGNPYVVEAESCMAFSRLEENRCYEIKCAE